MASPSSAEVDQPPVKHEEESLDDAAAAPTLALATVKVEPADSLSTSETENEEPVAEAAEPENEEPNAETGKELDNSSHPSIGGSSPGKIFVGGLPKETHFAAFTKHFEKYGKITDSVIIKDRMTGNSRGFGFITYADPSVIDKVIEDSHVFNGKTVEIKRTIPKGAIGAKDFKTKKIFVGGILTTITEGELKNFFAKFGEVKECMIIKDPSNSRSRGFGFVTFDTEQAVDDLLIKGNKIDFAGVQVEIKKAEPKKASNPRAPFSKHFNDDGPASGVGFGDAFGGGGFGADSYMSDGGFWGRPGSYGGYASEYDGGYGGHGSTGMGLYRGESSLGFSGRYGGGFGSDFDVGGYDGLSHDYGAYGGYGSGLGGGFGGVGGYGGSGGGLYGRRGYGPYRGSAGGRFHPYGR